MGDFMQEPFDMGESYYTRSNHMLEQARSQLEKARYAESISASQETIELATKAIFLFFQQDYSKSHEFKEEEFIKVLEKIPEELKFRNFPRLFLINRFWSGFYLVAKYGNERLGIGPDKLFTGDEAKLALKHAEECNSAAYQVLDWVRMRRRKER
jgi:HEPN domain-containing protein